MIGCEASRNDMKDWGGRMKARSFRDFCIWCPGDDECHRSPQNECNGADNIVDRSPGRGRPPRYDPDAARKMLLASAAAYSVDPEKCLRSTLPESKMVIKKIAPADGALFDRSYSGYVAISHEEKAVIIAFRGPANSSQTLRLVLAAFRLGKRKFLFGEVQACWKEAFDSLWPRMEKEFRYLRSRHPDYDIRLTGHSIGGAIASLASTWIADEESARGNEVALYTFGMPRVGNHEYALRHDELVHNSWRVVNSDDLMPHLQESKVSTRFKGLYHQGVEVCYYKGSTSPYSPYRECHGLKYDNGRSCNFDPAPPYSLTHHMHYFGIEVETHCKEVARKHVEAFPLEPDQRNSSSSWMRKKNESMTYEFGPRIVVKLCSIPTFIVFVVTCSLLVVLFAVILGLVLGRMCWGKINSFDQLGLLRPWATEDDVKG